MTAFHLAAGNGHTEAMALLIKSGVDTAAKDNVSGGRSEGRKGRGKRVAGGNGWRKRKRGGRAGESGIWWRKSGEGGAALQQRPRGWGRGLGATALLIPQRHFPCQKDPSEISGN